jgi:hypothetical protein
MKISIKPGCQKNIHKEFKKKDEKPASSLKKLAGGWTPKEAMEFEEAIKSCGQIDEEMWK